MSLWCLAVNMTPPLPSKSLHPGGEHGREIMKRNVCAQGHGLRERFLEEGVSAETYRGCGGNQGEGAGSAKEEKTKHAVL